LWWTGWTRAERASLDCKCDGGTICQGRTELAAYWRPRLEAFAPRAFGLDEILPAADGVMLDYQNFEGQPVRIFFAFNEEGKIWRSHCAPSAPRPPQP
jgi:hypothetical protein